MLFLPSVSAAASTIPAMPSPESQPIARLLTERAELLTRNGWLRLPVADADALNRMSVEVNDHLDALGVEVTVAIKVSEKAGKRRAWIELAVATADVDRATAWPATLLN